MIDEINISKKYITQKASSIAIYELPTTKTINEMYLIYAKKRFQSKKESFFCKSMSANSQAA